MILISDTALLRQIGHLASDRARRCRPNWRTEPMVVGILNQLISFTGIPGTTWTTYFELIATMVPEILFLRMVSSKNFTVVGAVSSSTSTSGMALLYLKEKSGKVLRCNVWKNVGVSILRPHSHRKIMSYPYTFVQTAWGHTELQCARNYDGRDWS